MGQGRESAQELVERILAERRAKASRCIERKERRAGELGAVGSEDFFDEHDAGEGVADFGTRIYEDEPILRTGAQFVRDRRVQAERAERAQASYVEAADSADDAAWRRLMAFGTVQGPNERQEASRSVADPAAPAAGAFGRRRDAAPGASVRRGGATAGRRGGAAAGRSDGAASERRNEKLPEWRRPARQASLLDFSLDDETPAIGAGIAPPPPKVDLPPLLQELRAMEREERAFLKSRDWLFVRQAKLAADYEDDYAYEGTFQHYFPTYQAMDDAQLRGYFAWRTRVRNGEVQRTSLSFAFVFVYELLNGVGVASPEDGYRKLRAFWEEYRALDAGIDRYARTWLHDYVVYHGLDQGLFDLGGEPEPAVRASARATSDADGELPFYEALCVLLAEDRPAAKRPESAASGDEKEPCGAGCAASGKERADGTEDEALFRALCAASSYRLESSAFFREEPQLVRRAACETWRALSAYCRGHRKRTLTESLFGTCTELPYPMFRSAVFYGETRHEDAVYEVSPVLRYVCRNGRWYEACYHEAHPNSKDLGRTLRTVDRTLRQRCGSKRQLKAEAVPKYLQDIVDRVVDGLVRERDADETARSAHGRRLEIDLSKLQGIRAAAAVTREALLTDEERSEGRSLDEGRSTGEASRVSDDPACTTDEGRPHASVSPAPRTGPAMRGGGTAGRTAPAVPAGNCFAGADGSASAADSVGLSADEAAWVRCLLDGTPAGERAGVLKRAGTTEELMADAVNEKLYDFLGDVAVEDAGAGPELVEDYRDDVKGLIGL